MTRARGIPAPWPERLIVFGAVVFILALAVSAYWERDIRWLHFFQAWMYVAAIVLSLRRSRWGWFVAISAAGLWDYANLFVTSFFINGLHDLAAWLATGRMAPSHQVIAVPAWTGNLLMLAGALWAWASRAPRLRADLAAFVATFVLTTGFLAADMALFQPRYLAIFPRLLHPHLP